MEQKTIKAPKTEIMKATSDDIRCYLRDAINLKYIFNDGWLYGIDYEDKDGKNLVYFTVEYYDYGYYDITYALEYKLDSVVVTFIGEMFEVKRETIYTPVKQEDPSDVEKGDASDPFEEDGSLFKSLKKAINNILGRSDLPDHVKKDKNGFHIEKFNDEKMISYEPLYTPPDIPDGVGEGMTEVESLKMVKQIKDKIEKGEMKFNLFHKVESEVAEWVDCFSNPWPECTVGDITVPENQPVGILKWHNQEAWDLRKSGEIKGPSIEGSAGNRRKVS